MRFEDCDCSVFASNLMRGRGEILHKQGVGGKRNRIEETKRFTHTMHRISTTTECVAAVRVVRARRRIAVTARDAPQTFEDMTQRFRVLIEQEQDGIFVAECPTLPGGISQGKTGEEALAKIRDAIQG